MSYSFQTKLDLPFEQAIERVAAALKEEGFVVLTEIDVKDTLKKKLDVNFRKYVILGACNPSLSHKALNTQLNIGLLLPCNVIVYEADGGSALGSSALFNQVTFTSTTGRILWIIVGILLIFLGLTQAGTILLPLDCIAKLAYPIERA